MSVFVDVSVAILEKVANKSIKRITNKLEWIETFKKAAKFLESFDQSSRDDNISIIFSKDNMKHLAEELSECSGFYLYNSIKLKMTELLSDLELDADEYSNYINAFCCQILNFLEKNKPEIATQCYLSNMRSDLIAHNDKIIEQNYEILAKIKDIEKGLYNYNNLFEEEAELENKSNDRFHIDLDFFKLDYKDDIDALDEYIETKNELFVIGRDIEETKYFVLNELKKIRNGNRIIIVKDEKTFTYFKKKRLSDFVFVIDYYNECINSYPNNLTIYILNQEHSAYIKSGTIIKLRPRLRNTIYNSISNAYNDIKQRDETASRIMKETNGQYLALKSVIFNGQNIVDYDIDSSDKDYLVKLLLISGFELVKYGEEYSNSYDCKLLTDYLGMSVEDSIVLINRYSNSNKPLFIKKCFSSKEVYLVACRELAWIKMSKYLSRSLLREFLNLAYEVLFDAKSIHYSKTLFDGCIGSIVFLKCREDIFGKQNEASSFLEKITEYNGDDYYEKLSKLVYDFVEVDPRWFLKELRKAIKNDAFLKVFENGCYTSYLWALEKALQLNDTFYDAIDCLFEMCKLNLNYLYNGNTCQNIVDKILVPWANFVGLSVSNRVAIANKYASSNWNDIYRLLPNVCSCVGALAPLQYLNGMEEKPISRKDIIDTMNGYLYACVENAGTDYKKASSLIESLPYYKMEIIDDIIKIIGDMIYSFSDYEKSYFYECVRNKIYWIRFYRPKDKYLNEYASKLELLISNIIYQDITYKYTIITIDSFNYPTLNPTITYSENKHSNFDYLSELDVLIEQIKKDNIKVNELVEATSRIEDSTQRHQRLRNLGMIIIDRIQNDYREDTAKDLLEFVLKDETNNIYVLQGYIASVISKDNSVFVNNFNVLTKGLSALSIVLLVKMLEINEKSISIFKGLDDSAKKILWSQIGVSIASNPIIIKECLSDCLEYGSFEMYTFILYNHKNDFSKYELYELFAKIGKFDDAKTTMSDYYYESIFNELRPLVFSDEIRIRNIAKIEKRFASDFHQKNVECYRWLLKNDPAEFAEIVNGVYADRPSDYYNYFGLMINSQFCPCENSGTVEYDELVKWINSFEKALKGKAVEELFYCLGKLFCHSPIGKDGYYPCESIRQYIEKLSEDSLKKMISGYISEKINTRGVYNATAGKNEKELSIHYKKIANELRNNYPKTANVYDSLSNDFLWQSQMEREYEE